jgi:hypothetical protein
MLPRPIRLQLHELALHSLLLAPVTRLLLLTLELGRSTCLACLRDPAGCCWWSRSSLAFIIIILVVIEEMPFQEVAGTVSVHIDDVSVAPI